MRVVLYQWERAEGLAGQALILFLTMVGRSLVCPRREYRGNVLRMEEPVWIHTTSRKPRCKAGTQAATKSRLPHVPSGEPYR